MSLRIYRKIRVHRKRRMVVWIHLNMGIGCIEKWVKWVTKEWVQGYIKQVCGYNEKLGSMET